MDNKFVVYKLYFTNNPYFLYGSTNYLPKREYAYINSLRKGNYSNNILQNVYNKYGEENLKFEIVAHNLPEDILRDVENIWIGANCGRTEDNKKGMNIRDAIKFRWGEESKKKVSISKKGKPSNMKGKTHTDETRKKISIKLKGKTTNKGREFSKEWRKNLSESQKGNSKGTEGIKVNQLDMEGNFIKEWKSAAEIARFFNKCNGSAITSVCKKKKNSAFGFKWEYTK